ncbi:MAG: lipase family protein, partial [Dehalococcoidia bacterium]|nr:lipase family protein [Dehalococcoidia bacterium]
TKMSQLCLLNAMYAAVVRDKVVGEHLFSVDPMTDPAWRKVAEENTPSPPGDIPVFIVQGLADSVVLPNTTALLAERFYAASSPLTVAWLADLDHFEAPKVGWPLVNTWLQQRFAGVPATSTRYTLSPVLPSRRP